MAQGYAVTYESKYLIIIETITDYTYVGYAKPGSSTASAVWRILRIDDSVTDTSTVAWADGNLNFDNIWDNKESLSYS